ncbi:NnrS family protein [Duganella sp. BJB488]|uniref:NnrS family protein n=1 Tax=unclassified Duganella TaxID=2636909 RepID=UPI000E353140|nr:MULTISPECIES: NnrS family protein [unclassified Duganella]RFP17727.1 NnrS family protein [Duganella sp. BJB489]RFP22236.1 NnrS family protein [Duganella sp. BJB488]RFP37569.1 NnrS family protein [Duganella sp. BJB480]
MSLLHIEEPAGQAAAWDSHPIWRLGFRPFYLVAAAFAALAIPLWMLRYLGWLPADAGGWLHVGFAWHMHEMVFGMAAAVVVGFLYTAAFNWTGFWTPVRGKLAALVALWLLGRLAMLLAPPLSGALVDWLFLPAAAWPLWRVMQKAGNRRNYFLVGLLGLMALANGVFHAITLGWIAASPIPPVQAAVLVIVLMEAAIGTRIIPMFTRNGAPGTNPQVQPRLDKWSLGLVVAFSVSWVAMAPAWLVAPIGVAAAVLVLLRLWRWQALRTGAVPLLWIMHLSYAWIAAGLVLLSLSRWQIVSASAGFHALTVGSMAGLILGMMTRTTLGHTGRPLRAGKFETAIFGLIQFSALSRVLSALGWDGGPALLVLSAVCWTTAFGLYVYVYAPYLTSPRADGKPG